MQRLHRKRIEIATKLWSQILRGAFASREELVDTLRKEYERASIEPIRGKSKRNAHDKELVVVYLVGKHGLGIDPEEYSKVYKKLFDLELKCEEAIDRVLSGEDPKEVFNDLFGEITEDIVFRVVRTAYVAALLEFMDEDKLIDLLARLEEGMPELSDRFRRFKKFYIAFRIAEAIVAREIRNRLEKEALKHALCIKFGAEKSAPSDNEVRMIATEVLGMPEYLVNDVLKARDLELKPYVGKRRK